MERWQERPPEISEADRARIRRALGRRLLWGGIAFLVVVALGLIPGMIYGISPSAARVAAIAAWILAPLVTIGVVVMAALKLRR